MCQGNLTVTTRISCSEALTELQLQESDLKRLEFRFSSFLQCHNLIPHSSVVVLSLHFATADEMKEINRTYREVDEVTDVLSFPMWEQCGVFVPEEWDTIPLGDIILCPEYILKRAQEEKLDYNQDLCLMFVHGMLHLVGYDHDTPEKQAEMWSEQANLLKNE